MALILAEDESAPPEGYEDIFRPSFWHWGLMRRLWAWEYGLTAFRLRVRKGGPRRVPPDRIGAKPGTAPKRPRAKKPRK